MAIRTTARLKQKAFNQAFEERRVASRVITFGPSEVRALPLAAGINVGGHYKWHFLDDN